MAGNKLLIALCLHKSSCKRPYLGRARPVILSPFPRSVSYFRRAARPYIAAPVHRGAASRRARPRGPDPADGSGGESRRGAVEGGEATEPGDAVLTVRTRTESKSAQLRETHSAVARAPPGFFGTNISRSPIRSFNSARNLYVFFRFRS